MSTQITEWMMPDDMISSGYGIMRYKKWCEEEMRNMVLEPNEEAYIAKHKRLNKIAVFIREKDEL